MRIINNVESVKKRIKHFEEFEELISEAQLIEEAERALMIDNAKCPTNINFKEVAQLICDKKYEEALLLIMEKNPIPAICSRLCPNQRLCEWSETSQGHVAYSQIHKFLAAKCNKNFKVKKRKEKVAVVGSGPSGLSCALKLAMNGVKVVVYESGTKLGGVLRERTPTFKLSEKILEDEIKFLESLGVEFKIGSVVGRIYSVDELSKEYNAVFLATGASVPRILDIPGVFNKGVLLANEYLYFVKNKKIKKAKHTVIIGGGSSAIDAARTAKRLGEDVTLIYRRTQQDMPVCEKDMLYLQEEEIQYLMLTNPVRILGDECVEGIECLQMMPGEEDWEGNSIPEPLEGTEFVIACDRVIIAVGQDVNPLVVEGSSVKARKRGKIQVNKLMQTNVENVFAGGSVVSGYRPIAFSIKDGVYAAENILKLFDGNLEKVEQDVLL